MSSNALDYITIRGFKSIASIEKLALRPINIIIGPNGSGKSNFIGAFAFLNKIREGRLQDTVTAAGGAERILHFGSKNTKEIHFHLSFENEVNQYKLTLAPTAGDSLYPTREFAYYWKRNQYPSPHEKALAPVRRRLEAGISAPDLEGSEKWVHDRLASWRLYHVHDTSPSSPMRKTAKVDDNRFLRDDGSNLAAFLLLLKDQHPGSYQLIRGSIQQVAPFFDDFTLEPLLRKPDTIQLEWRHRNSEQYFDASSLSDGTLRFVALATLFLQPDKFLPSAILVDEPELGLHPSAITILAALIRIASRKTQVIVSTQSSLLLDHFDPEDVLVANRVDGRTEISRLQANDLNSWLEEYSLGQLWEKNEIGGRPASI
jgi:predicted ATPase